MSERHEPDPEFVARLEEEIRFRLRRARIAPRRGGTRLLRAAAVLLVAALAAAGGAAGALAAERARSARLAGLETTRARILLAAAEARVEQEGKRAEEIESLHRAGLATDRERAAAERRVTAAEADRRRRSLDLEETRATGSPPRDGIADPEVEGRDYVSERLRIDLDDRLAEEAAARSALEPIRRLVEAGMESAEALRTAELVAAVAAVGVEEARALLSARERFLRGEETAERVLLLALRVEAVARRDAAALRVAGAEERLGRIRSMVEAGRASAGDLRAVEAEVAEQRVAVRVGELEIARINEMLD